MNFDQAWEEMSEGIVCIWRDRRYKVVQDVLLHERHGRIAMYYGAMRKEEWRKTNECKQESVRGTDDDGEDTSSIR